MMQKSIRVYGKVQGVFFRASTRDQAICLGIKGIVRNEADGSVYIEAEGDDVSMSQFVEWCKIGPARAEVKKVEVNDLDFQNYSSFQIIR